MNTAMGALIILVISLIEYYKKIYFEIYDEESAVY